MTGHKRQTKRQRSQTWQWQTELITIVLEVDYFLSGLCVYFSYKAQEVFGLLQRPTLDTRNVSHRSPVWKVRQHRCMCLHPCLCVHWCVCACAVRLYLCICLCDKSGEEEQTKVVLCISLWSGRGKGRGTGCSKWGWYHKPHPSWKETNMLIANKKSIKREDGLCCCVSLLRIQEVCKFAPLFNEQLPLLEKYIS